MNDRSLATGPLVWAGIVGVTCLLLIVFQTALWLVLPLLLAVIAYYALSPCVTLVMRRGWERPQAVLITTGLLTLLLLVVAFIVFVRVSRFSNDWRDKLVDYGTAGAQLLVDMQSTLSRHSPIVLPVWQPSDIRDKFGAWAQESGSGIALELLHWIPSLLLVPYLTYFFLLDGPRFKRFLVRAIPNAFFEKALYLFYRVEDQLRRYLQGMLLLTALDGFCLGVGLWALGLGSPFFLATVAAILAWLPYLGSIAGCLIVVLVAKHDVPESHWLPYEAIALFIVVRLLDDFVFLPLTIGRSLHMHPLVTVLMILLGGAVAGISGLLLVMPVLGVVMVIGEIVGELIADERVRARHRHAKALHRLRAQADL